MPVDSAEVEIHTDGACSGNPGPGGYGAILRYKNVEREILGWTSKTTNNRMEMLAAIRALEALKRPCKVKIFTDSQYLKNGITQWVSGWIRKGWKNSAGKTVKNVDLWQRLLELVKIHTLEWIWLKGHAGHELNERADKLARFAIVKGQKGELPEDVEGRLPV